MSFSTHENGHLHLLIEATSRLYQLQSLCISALTRGYQAVIDQAMLERQHMEQHLEHRLQALQRINSISNSTMDQDQTLEVIAGKMAEELGADYCSIFYYDELQRTLTLASNKWSSTSWRECIMCSIWVKGIVVG